MTRRCFAAALMSLFLLTSASAADVSPFLGKWEIDKKKPEAVGAPEDLKLDIKREDDGVVIRSKYREPKSSMYPLLWVGIMTYEMPLSVDGNEKTNHIGPFTHVAKTWWKEIK
ncbi:MAG: hypothetical protein WKF37_08555 [Bryobacteraceae bacterium]